MVNEDLRWRRRWLLCCFWQAVSDFWRTIGQADVCSLPIALASMAGQATINTFSLDLVSAVPKRVHLRFAYWRAMNRITEQRGPVKTGHLFAGTACEVRSNTKKRPPSAIHGNERADRGPLPCIAALDMLHVVARDNSMSADVAVEVITAVVMSWATISNVPWYPHPFQCRPNPRECPLTSTRTLCGKTPLAPTVP